MNISNFKEGDVITRVEPCVYVTESAIKDGSYLGDRIMFLGCEKKIIFYKHLEGGLAGDVSTLSFARDRWDEGWDYYPEELWQRVLKKYSKKLKGDN